MKHNIDYEKAVLACILTSKITEYEKIFDILNEDNFYFDSHKYIFLAMNELFEKNIELDILILTEKLKKMKKLDKIGGIEYLKVILNSETTIAHSIFYAEELKNISIRRKIENKLNIALENIYSCETLEELDLEIECKKENKELQKIDKLISETIENYEDVKNGDYNFIQLGFPKIDEKIRYRQGTLNILAAETSIGKTAFALNIVLNNLKKGKKVLYFSLEMTNIEIMNRLLACYCDLNISKITDGKLTDMEITKMHSRSFDFLKFKFFCDDTAGLSFEEISRKINKENEKEKVDFVVIDHLGLIKTDNTKDTKNEKVGKITMGLKNLSKTLNFPILVLAQLNRGEASEQSKPPTLRRLRDSGNIEQDADTVMFLYRKNRQEQITDIMIEKNRNGELAKLEVVFSGWKQKFTELTNYNGGYNGYLGEKSK